MNLLLLSLDDFSALNTAGTNLGAFDNAFEDNLDPLKIRIESSQSLSYNL